MSDPEEERDLAHEADMRALYSEQLAADCGGEMAYEFDDDGGDPYLDDPCPRCNDDGRDPWNDYLLPRPFCGGACAATKGYSTSELPWNGDGGDFYRVYCSRCQSRQLFHRTHSEAVAAWNRRAAAELGMEGEGK